MQEKCIALKGILNAILAEKSFKKELWPNSTKDEFTSSPLEVYLIII